MTSGIYQRTAETKRKMSEALKKRYTFSNHPMKGKHLSKETRQKLSEALKGKKSPLFGKHPSKKTRQKMSDAQKGKNHPMWGKHHSKSTRKKLSDAHINPSKETRQKLSDAMKGKHHSEETCKKISEANKGAKSSSWLGGISFEPYGVKFTKQLREQIRARDNFTCQECKKKSRRTGLSF